MKRTEPSTSRPKETLKKRSHRVKPKAHEIGVAAVVGGRRQPGSGAYDDAKGDVRRDGNRFLEDFPLLVECKRTSKNKSLSLKASWLAKITKEAFSVDKHPALAIQFDKEVMDELVSMAGVPVETDWIMFPATTVSAIFEALGQDGPDTE